MHTKVFNEKVEGKGIWILYTPWVITSFLFNFSHFLNNVWHYKIDIFMATLETNGPPKILSYLQTIPYAYIIYGYGYSQISLFFYFYKNKSKWSILWRGTILWLKSVTFSIYTYLDRNWTLEFVDIEGRPRYEKMLISFNFSTTAVGGHGQTWPGMVLLEIWSNGLTGQHGLCDFSNRESHFEWVIWHVYENHSCESRLNSLFMSSW